MRAAWYEGRGPARDVLKLGDLPKPAPGPGEVLVAVKASGVNPSDTKGRGGTGAVAMAFPRVVPHQDGAGIVEAVGEGVSRGLIGEPVWIYEAQLGRAYGTAADYVALPAENAVPMPDGIDFAQAACLGVPALTAHRCVFADGPVDGRTVLVTGGGGAVGFYAIQFAKRGGARVIATVSTEEQADAARDAGADLVIDRKSEDVAARAAAFTGATDLRGIDRIVEVAFGANLPDTLRMLKRNGVVAAYSSDAEPEPSLPFWPLLVLDATVRFVLVYAMTRQAHAEAIAATNAGIREGWLRHRLAHRLPLDRIAEAHELVEQGRGGGKVILDIG